MEKRQQTFIQSRLIPTPHIIAVAPNGLFRIADGCRISIASPESGEELALIIKKIFSNNWACAPELVFENGINVPQGDGYTLNVAPELCSIAASTANGVRNALKSLRQLAEAERGVLKSTCFLVPALNIEDEPDMDFRGIHFCWFPETPTWEIEREIRLAAYYKFNYAVIESWGMVRLDSHPEFCWEEFAVGKSEISRLVALAKELGVTLIPQMNLFGHATASRCGAGKHVLLDRHPEYASLFEPDGWTWCLGNPQTKKYLAEMVTELHDLYERPPFFHIGCDEAYNAGSCSLCADNYPDKVKAHLMYFHDLFAERGARVMMWHDMLLCRDDPRWDGYIVCGNSDEGMGGLYKELPKDIVVCDWQYGYPEKAGKEPTWATSLFFRDAGYDVLVCPWLEPRGTASLGKCVKTEKLFGMLETTWHLNRGSQRVDTLFAAAANAAWNPQAASMPVHRREYVNRHIREINHDMGLKEYIQLGTVQYQVNSTPFQGE